MLHNIQNALPWHMARQCCLINCFINRGKCRNSQENLATMEHYKKCKAFYILNLTKEIKELYYGMNKAM